ncbi:TetR/AcrR family transcriptional regulator [Actinomadura barringtoniae]|uniref:TetR/AcrR family transcriptional regulator n=1 Tax=Actinomadura barringtoniae TaxID=1427535 RepID=A0A939T979_9ACTN|nr:TetR/AcrR family transcriptional regulator [Actinomadura barringtoniae]MBO2447700.1 TetR/AcrR family transcriptional regulator [Actinomadura barringtoniae]
MEDSTTRTAILDATQQIMLEDGYAAVSSRRVADKAGVNSALVYYYFGTMDDLFIATFQRGAEQSYRRQVEALSSDQPLWALWEMIHDAPRTALTMEFVALANHRKAIRSEITRSSQRFRAMHLEAASKVMAKSPPGPDLPSPEAIVLLMSSVSRFLLMEQAFEVSTGHAEMIAHVEDHLRRIEGERRTALRDA